MVTAANVCFPPLMSKCAGRSICHYRPTADLRRLSSELRIRAIFDRCCEVNKRPLQLRRSIHFATLNREKPTKPLIVCQLRRLILTYRRHFAAALVLTGLPLTSFADTLTVDIAKDMFSGAQLVSDPIDVDCTLSGGAETTCIQITVVHAPTTYEAGP